MKVTSFLRFFFPKLISQIREGDFIFIIFIIFTIREGGFHLNLEAKNRE